MTVRAFQGIEPSFGKDAYIDPMALVLGDVQMGDDCSVWPCTVIRGDVHRIHIGDRCNIQDGSVLHVTHAGKFTAEGLPAHFRQRHHCRASSHFTWLHSGRQNFNWHGRDSNGCGGGAR